jgi:hypothetical protein
MRMEGCGRTFGFGVRCGDFDWSSEEQTLCDECEAEEVAAEEACAAYMLAKIRTEHEARHDDETKL